MGLFVLFNTPSVISFFKGVRTEEGERGGSLNLLHMSQRVIQLSVLYQKTKAVCAATNSV